MGRRSDVERQVDQWQPVGTVARRLVARALARHRFGHVRRTNGHGRVRRTALGDQVEGWTLHQPGHG